MQWPLCDGEKKSHIKRNAKEIKFVFISSVCRRVNYQRINRIANTRSILCLLVQCTPDICTVYAGIYIPSSLITSSIHMSYTLCQAQCGVHKHQIKFHVRSA